MAGHLICVDYDSGVPLFVRNFGDVEKIPYPIMASLNGVKVFGKQNRCDLLSTLSQTCRMVWKDFYDKLTLIYVGTDDSPLDMHILNLLDNVFDCLVFQNGLDAVLKNTRTEKLKSLCRNSYPLIDEIMHGLKPHQNTLFFGDLTGCADVSFQLDGYSTLQSLLDSTMEAMGSLYGCFVVHGTVIVATKDWWSMSGPEIHLLLLSSLEPLGQYGYKDIPVFLPKISPKVNYRFAIFRVTSTVKLCALYGSEPHDFNHVRKEAEKLGRNLPDAFHMFDDTCAPHSLYARHFPIDKKISGFLMVNTQQKKCAFSLFPERQNDSRNLTKKLDLLRTFYRNVVGAVFPWEFMSPVPVFETRTSSVVQSSSSAGSSGSGAAKWTMHHVLETYWASEHHKCHAVRLSRFQLFVIYEPEVSTTLMRLTSQKLITDLAKDRMIR